MEKIWLRELTSGLMQLRRLMVNHTGSKTSFRLEIDLQAPHEELPFSVLPDVDAPLHTQDHWWIEFQEGKPPEPGFLISSGGVRFKVFGSKP